MSESLVNAKGLVASKTICFFVNFFLKIDLDSYFLQKKLMSTVAWLLDRDSIRELDEGKRKAFCVCVFIVWKKADKALQNAACKAYLDCRYLLGL